MFTFSRTLVAGLFLFLVGAAAFADGIKDNQADQVRQVPPAGIELNAKDRAELIGGLKRLEDVVVKLRKNSHARIQNLLPDVEIFSRAVQQGLKYRELFSKRDVESAKKVLAEGQRRAESLLQGRAPWTTQTGLVVRGYRSKIDQTVQPYGLVIPESYSGIGKEKFRLDLWFHGRGERSSEAVFIAGRMNSVGQIAPRDTIVLHPYGRYCNAFKFAGEIDVLEALEHAKRNYRIDENRVAVRGFSMGGAGCWQMAVHYPDLFFAANPGAGFSETPEFLKFFQKETLKPTWYEKKLWRMYDCPGYAVNLFQLPTVAYSGELDIQKQAADIMERALHEKDLLLTHIIGPKTKHAIHRDSLKIIETKLAQLAEQGRTRLPHEIRFATYTLKYNRMHWLTVMELGEHWEQATVTGRILPRENTINLRLHNVKAIRISIPAGRSPFAPDRSVRVVLSTADSNGSDDDLSKSQTIISTRPGSDQSWDCQLHYADGKWHRGPSPEKGLRKQHNLQGPIDDALMDSFIVVRPTGKPNHEAVGKWSKSELDHFVRQWRQQFRGDVIVKRDDEITKADIAGSNLILFGDPASNQIIGSIIKQLPIQWTSEEVIVGKKRFDASHHAPVLIYPNPANPRRYVVLNSGFTYREYAYLNNARQVPKLPDWAVVDLRTPADSLWPGRIVDANFFDEKWQLKRD